MVDRVKNRLRDGIKSMLDAGVRGSYNINTGELWVNPKLSPDDYNAVYEHEKTHEGQVRRWPALFDILPYLFFLALSLAFAIMIVVFYSAIANIKPYNSLTALFIALVSVLLVVLFPECHAGYIAFRKTGNIGQFFEFMLCPLMIVFLVLAFIKLLGGG